MERFRFRFKTVVILITLISLNIVSVSATYPSPDGNIIHVWEKVEITLTAGNAAANKVIEKSAGPKVTTGWAYGAATPKQDLIMLYFERDCPKAKLTGVKPNTMYIVNWFNPGIGKWIVPDTRLISDDSGSIMLSQYPDNSDLSGMDWAIKLTLLPNRLPD
jgi:hypothetical protein